MTEADVMNFAGVSGDFHPLHVSTEQARESDFGERVVHGNLVFAASTQFVPESNPLAFSYGHDELRFVEPVTIGDTLSVTVEVIEKEPHDDEYGRVVKQFTVTNQDDEVVLVDKHILLVERATDGSGD